MYINDLIVINYIENVKMLPANWISGLILSLK